MRSEVLRDINVDITINSGQVFLWHKHGDTWYGVDGNNAIFVDENSCATYLGRQTDFFRQTDDISDILKHIGADRRVLAAIQKNLGLRILRQNPFQCAISFVISSNSNITNIRRTLFKLCDRYGRCTEYDGYTVKLFPEPARLARATRSDLLTCGVGYRADYVRNLSLLVDSGGLDLESMRGATYSDAKEQLLKISGVGDKVADCIMLFSLDILEAFPLDRWMLRALRHYDIFDVPSIITPKQYVTLHNDIIKHFGKYAGYAQQYLFRAERSNKNLGWL